jgi:UMF1 family MFS transporter
MAAVVGLVQGGVQGLSRSFYGRLVPPAHSAEFFGFFNMMGKFSTVFGPVLVGFVAVMTHDSRLSIAAVALLFILGGLLLWRVRDPQHAGMDASQAAGSKP